MLLLEPLLIVHLADLEVLLPLELLDLFLALWALLRLASVQLSFLLLVLLIYRYSLIVPHNLHAIWIKGLVFENFEVPFVFLILKVILVLNLFLYVVYFA